MPFHREMYEIDPNINFMATFTSVPPPAGSTLEELDVEAAKYIKIWTHHLPRVWPPEADRTKENVDWFRARDRVIWSYTCSTQMQNWPALDYYRFSPWRGFLSGLDGICYWTLIGSKGDGFDHGDGYDEGMAVLGLNNAPVPTKRLEALREGLEDVAYMHILRERLSAAKAKDAGHDFSEQEKLLWEIPLAIEKSKDAWELEIWRENTAKAILALPVN